MNYKEVRDEWMEIMVKMIETKGDSYRVSINDDGTFTVVDFTMPSFSERRLKRNVPQEDVDQWMMEKVSILRIAPEGNLINGIGFKVHDRLYYIEEGDHNEPEQDCA
jgi:hypothetical protein